MRLYPSSAARMGFIGFYRQDLQLDKPNTVPLKVREVIRMIKNAGWRLCEALRTIAKAILMQAGIEEDQT